jgi:hypothetical protein
MNKTKLSNPCPAPTIVLYFTIKTILSLGGIARGDGYSCTTLYHDINENRCQWR